MGSAKKELSTYIRSCLLKGYSFKQIENALRKRGYSEKAAAGILLNYKHKGSVIKWFSITALSLLFITSFLLGGSGVVGLVVLDHTATYSDSLELFVKEDSFYSWRPSVQGEIGAVGITGRVSEGGTAKIFIENNGEQHLIFDSERIESTQFNQICHETCIVRNFNREIYTLVFEIENGALEIDSIVYDIETTSKVEQIPTFLEIPNQKLNIGSSLTIDLDSFFNSTLDTEYTYLAEQDFIAVSIDGSKATITALREGRTPLYFIAETEGIQFISNLVEFDILQGSRDDLELTGTAKPPIEEETSLNWFSLVLIIIFVLLILALFALPSHYYAMHSLAGTLDKKRKDDSLTQTLDTYLSNKRKFRRASQQEKTEILDKMTKTLDTLSPRVPKNKQLQEFNKISQQFEKTKSKRKKEELYENLRSLYLKIIETNIRAKDKKILYKRLNTYYKQLHSDGKK